MIRVMRKKILFVAFCFSVFSILPAAENPGLMQNSISSLPKKIIINNRPLIKINGKTISLMDVVKKMDLFALENYPKVMQSLPDRLQFYMQNWIPTFQDIVQTELFLSDAETKDIKVSEGDIREEVQERFGPRIMPRLDELNLTYEEAWEIVRKELIVRKIRNFKIYSKAFQSITPAIIKKKYEEYAAANPPLEEWEYKVISLRAKQEDLLQAFAQKISDLLSQKQMDIAKAIEKLKEEDKETSSLISLNISDTIKADEKTISNAHKSALQALAVNSYSQPIKQVSRYDKTLVYRIFYLASHHKKDPPSFETVFEEIKNRLISEAIDKETKVYVERLQNKFGINIENAIPNNFQPFSLGN